MMFMENKTKNILITAFALVIGLAGIFLSDPNASSPILGLIVMLAFSISTAKILELLEVGYGQSVIKLKMSKKMAWFGLLLLLSCAYGMILIGLTLFGHTGRLTFLGVSFAWEVVAGIASGIIFNKLLSSSK